MKETKAFRDGLGELGYNRRYELNGGNETFGHIYSTDVRINGYNIGFSEVYNDGECTTRPTLTINGITADKALAIIDGMLR